MHGCPCTFCESNHAGVSDLDAAAATVGLQEGMDAMSDRGRWDDFSRYDHMRVRRDRQSPIGIDEFFPSLDGVRGAAREALRASAHALAGWRRTRCAS